MYFFDYEQVSPLRRNEFFKINASVLANVNIKNVLCPDDIPVHNTNTTLMETQTLVFPRHYVNGYKLCVQNLDLMRCSISQWVLLEMLCIENVEFKIQILNKIVKSLQGFWELIVSSWVNIKVKLQNVYPYQLTTKIMITNCREVLSFPFTAKLYKFLPVVTLDVVTKNNRCAKQESCNWF